MRVQLKEFQAGAVTALHGRLQQMRRSYEDEGILSSVCLSSVTGSGKTVMCAAVIEALFFGNDDLGLASDERACVLWVSDSPSLNEQTRARFVSCADKLADWPGDTRCLESVDNTFCASHQRMEPRHAYFLSKDLLGRGNKLVTGGEENAGHVFWDVLDRTITDPSVNLYLFIDEAHRGFGNNRAGGKVTETIYGNLVNGYDGRAPMPMVVGVSATPERFERRMDASPNRDRKARVHVSPEEVQESGLVKDTIELRVPEDADPVEHQYLTMAAERFQLCREHWGSYCTSEHEDYVWPLMILQVKDSPSTDMLREMCEQVCALVPGLNEAMSFAHVFGDHKDLAAGRFLIPYIKPEDVEESLHVQVLFAKEAISNGWDCPRAEVIFSQRNRRDPTYIAQLIGRMVRTPLARRIDADDMLNSIACYLPQFDREAAQGVVDCLTGETDDMGGTGKQTVTIQPVTVREAKPRTQEDYELELAAYEANVRAQKVFEKLQSGHQGELSEGLLETYEVILSVEPPTVLSALGISLFKDAGDLQGEGEPGAIKGDTKQQANGFESIVKPIPMKPPAPRSKRDASFTPEEWEGVREAFASIPVRRNPKKAANEFKSLLNTASLFVETGIDRDTDARVKTSFASSLAGELVSHEAEVVRARAEVETTNTKVIRIDRLNDNEVTETGETVIVDDDGIRKAAADASPVFTKELVNAYRKRQLEHGVDMRQTCLDLAAACRVQALREDLAAWAKRQRMKMFDDAATKYDYLSERDKQRYRELEGETAGKLETHLRWPEAVNIRGDGEPYEKHIVQREDGTCPLNLDGAEKAVLRQEFKRSRTVSFYRNPSESMSPMAFSIPYKAADGLRAMHPDFIFFVRDERGSIRPSIIDPHGIYLADTLAKLKGCVEYLREYPDAFKQFISIAPMDGGYRMLNLQRAEVQETIMAHEGDAAILYTGPLSNSYVIDPD